MINIGTHVKIQSTYAGYPANGITGVIDDRDESDVPYHVLFDTPRNGVESGWFEERLLIVLPVTRKQLNDELDDHLHQLRQRIDATRDSMKNLSNSYSYREYTRGELTHALAEETELVSSEMQEEYTTFVATLEAAITELEQAMTGIPPTFR